MAVQGVTRHQNTLSQISYTSAVKLSVHALLQTMQTHLNTLMFSTDGPWFSNCVKKIVKKILLFVLVFTCAWYQRVTASRQVKPVWHVSVWLHLIHFYHNVSSFLFFLLSVCWCKYNRNTVWNCLNVLNWRKTAYFMYIMYWWCPVFFNSFFKVCISLFYICN